ncbi:MAG: DUF4340 domain-containing protein [Candidatus Gracilibacteria bacterium]|nr:DUF4340 domain-containing protein [Candidatus Gracilibacteria bacterium]
MKSSRFRSTYLFAGLFVVLLLFVVFFENEGSDKARKNAKTDKAILSEQQLESLDQVVIKSPEIETVLLTENGTDFTLEDGSVVDRDESSVLLEELIGLSVGTVVSKNKENWQKYGLTDDTQKMLVLSNGEENYLKMYFGNGGNTSTALYARIDGEDEVREVNTQVSRFFAYDAEAWKNKHLVLTDQDDIKELEVRIGEDVWSFSQDSLGSWIWNQDGVTTPIEDVDAVDAYYEGLLAFKATGFAEDGIVVDGAQNFLTFTLSDGMQSVVSIQKTDDDNPLYLASVSGQDTVFTLSSDFSVPLRPLFVDALVEKIKEQSLGEDESSTLEEGSPVASEEVPLEIPTE